MLKLLLFMYIFAFKISDKINFVNSTVLVGIILLMYFIVNTKYRDKVLSIIGDKKVLSIFIYLFFIILFCLFVSMIHLSYDFSIIKTFINQFINLIIGILIYALYTIKKQDIDILSEIIYVFIFQSIIQLISFLSPSIREFLNIFRYESAIIRGQLDYGYIRGLAVSGSAFFGLASAYGLINMYYVLNWNKLFTKIKVLRIVFLALILFGGLSAGRTSFIGFIIAIFYVFINNIKKMKFKLLDKFNISLINVIITGLIFIVIVTMGVNIFKNDRIINQINRFNKFAFEIIYNKVERNEIKTNSTYSLFNNMYFKVDVNTFLFGDGYYTSKDGYYYKGTDAGYMRNILYFGFSGIIILFFYQLKFFLWENKNLFLQNILIVIYILIIHVKGDVLGFSIMLQNILFLVYLQNLFQNDELNR